MNSIPPLSRWNLRCVVHTRKVCFIHLISQWPPCHGGELIPDQSSRSALPWPHHDFRFKPKIRVMPHKKDGDAFWQAVTHQLCRQHPIFGATNGMGPLCRPWQQRFDGVFRQRIIWYSQKKGVVCHRRGIRNFIVFTASHPPGCFPLVKHIGTYRLGRFLRSVL